MHFKTLLIAVKQNKDREESPCSLLSTGLQNWKYSIYRGSLIPSHGLSFLHLFIESYNELMTIQALPYNVFVLVSFSVLFWIKAIISGYSYKYKGSNYKKGNDGKEQNVY